VTLAFVSIPISLSFSIYKTRTENILRSHPESRLARELHLASIEAKEQEDIRKLKDAAIGGVTAAAAVGVAAGIVSLLLSKR
jgi:cation transporter-like permease